MANDSITKTLTVAVLLCIVCSVLVSTAAVKLKPLQEKNKALFTKKNILQAAGLMEEGQEVDVEQLFENIQVKIVDLASGDFDDSIDAAKYNQKTAAKDPARSIQISGDQDLAKIKHRAMKVPVYLVQEGGELQTIILPIHGKGLWGTMYAFLALEGDANTVKGYTFYDHAETPGLGGEVENRLWKQQWIGKKIFDKDWNLVVQVLKGKVNLKKPEAIHQADGLSGATLTTVGVNNLMRYWLSENGFGKFLVRIRNQGGGNG
jgi:Na+-transporting NADH:ubiquinone oxidoreductase subunit C